MIKEAYCSFEVAKLLKDKGFEGECIAYYSKYKDNNLNLYRWRNRTTYVNVRNNGYTLVPTHQMAMAWLREVHKVLIVIDAYHADHWEGYIDTFEINIYSHASTIIVPNEIAHHTDYEEAVEAALKFCLENLI